MRIFGASLVLVALSACSSTAPRDPRLELGIYGGEDVGVVVEASRVGFIFPCAGGAVNGTITLASDGSFDVRGTWADGGNAFGVDHTPKPARYVGKVMGRHIHFQLIMPPDAPPPTNAYDADYGVAPRAPAC